jgi:hypothetical protein
MHLVRRQQADFPQAFELEAVETAEPARQFRTTTRCCVASGEASGKAPRHLPSALANAVGPLGTHPSPCPLGPGAISTEPPHPNRVIQLESQVRSGLRCCGLACVTRLVTGLLRAAQGHWFLELTRGLHVDSDKKLPHWLPPSVLHTANRIYAQVSTEDEPGKAMELLDRLTFDPRMENVWNELRKKKRKSYKSSDEYVHPAGYSFSGQVRTRQRQALDLSERGGETDRKEAKRLEQEAALIDHLPDGFTFTSQEQEQDAALGYLFYHAYWYVLRPSPLISASEANEALGQIWSLATSLRLDAEKLRSFGMEDEALELKRIARRCEEQSFWDDPQDDCPWLVARHRGDDHLRAYVLGLSDITRLLFRTPLYGVLAAITNVALNRDDITDKHIREMLRHRSGI